MQFEKSVDYKVFTLENPKRIVVDIMEEISTELPKHLQGRIGKHPWGTRIVFERDFDYVKAFSLQDPFRIVMDVYKKPVERQMAKSEEELIEIIDPAFIRVLRHTETAKGEEKVVSQVRRGQVITQRRVIVIDPGHGGHDPGAIGFMGIREKEVVLAIGKKLAELLEEDGRFHVVMTR
ncbi:MAG: N-acetylmuramoyl-L-alanine amidase, partial [Aquificaceae bacterium]